MIRKTFRVPGNPEPVSVIWFTVREQEVLCLVCLGKASKDMAATLGISVDTVRACTSRMIRAVGVGNRGGLIVWGLKNPLQPDGSVVLQNGALPAAVPPELVPLT